MCKQYTAVMGQPHVFIITVRLGPSHRFESELNRFEVETLGTGGAEKGNASVFGQTVQARLPPCAPTGNKWPHTTSTGPTVTGASGAKKR